MSEKQFMEILPIYQFLGDVTNIHEKIDEIFGNYDKENLGAIIDDLETIMKKVADLQFDLITKFLNKSLSEDEE